MTSKGSKFSTSFSPNDAISRKNGNRDRIFMMALDGRHEMKYARYLNLLLSCRKVYRACDRGIFIIVQYLVSSRMKRKIREIRRKKMKNNIECLLEYYSMDRGNCEPVKVSLDIAPRAINRFTGARLRTFMKT